MIDREMDGRRQLNYVRVWRDHTCVIMSFTTCSLMFTSSTFCAVENQEISYVSNVKQTSRRCIKYGWQSSSSQKVTHSDYEWQGLFPNASNHNWRSVDARISLVVSLTDQVLSWTWLWARRKLSRIRSWRAWQRSWFWWSWWNYMIELTKIRFSRTALRRMDLSVVNYEIRRNILNVDSSDLSFDVVLEFRGQKTTLGEVQLCEVQSGESTSDKSLSGGRIKAHVIRVVHYLFEHSTDRLEKKDSSSWLDLCRLYRSHCHFL